MDFLVFFRRWFLDSGCHRASCIECGCHDVVARACLFDDEDGGLYGVKSLAEAPGLLIIDVMLFKLVDFLIS